MEFRPEFRMIFGESAPGLALLRINVPVIDLCERLIRGVDRVGVRLAVTVS